MCFVCGLCEWIYQDLLVLKWIILQKYLHMTTLSLWQWGLWAFQCMDEFSSISVWTFYRAYNRETNWTVTLNTQKWKFGHWLTFMSFQTSMTAFLLWNTKRTSCVLINTKNVKYRYWCVVHKTIAFFLYKNDNHLLTVVFFQTCMTFFLLWNTKVCVVFI